VEPIRFFYIFSAVLFILGLKGLSNPRTARLGMIGAALGMLLAVIGTLFHHEIVHYTWIAVGLAIGAVVGAAIGLSVPMTAVPQRTAFSHALGALAAALIGVAEYQRHHELGQISAVLMVPLGFEVIVGFLTFTGSLMAAGKLQELLPGRPMIYRGQNILNFALLASILLIAGYLVFDPHVPVLFYLMVVLSLAFGVLLILPIGAADMPTVIALLNSYGGLADAAMGFVLMNKIQIITGSLDGTSGFLLALLMCRAMNRSPANVLFGAFGQVQEGAGTVTEAKGTIRSIQADEATVLFESARSVIFVPGYGRAGAASGRGARDPAREARRRREVRDPSRRGPYAGTHERAPRRGERAVRQAPPDGAGEPVLRRVRRRDRRRRERRDESGGAYEQVEPALRHADPRGRSRALDHRPEAQHEPGLRGRRQRALLQREVHDAVRRRQGLDEQAPRGDEDGALSSVRFRPASRSLCRRPPFGSLGARLTTTPRPLHERHGVAERRD
jgi:NAD/NADP transhydrogenase beta subunit